MRERSVILLFALAAGAVVAGTVLAAFVLSPEHSLRHEGCHVEDTRGAAVAAASETTDTSSEGGRSKAVRTLTYTVPAGDEADVVGCVSTGALTLGVTGGDHMTVEVAVTGWGGSPGDARLDASHVQPVVLAGDGYLAVLEQRSWHAFGDRAAMAVTIRVPATMRLDADLAAGTGAITVDGPRLVGLDASAGTGAVHLRPSYAQGPLDVSTGTGAIDARFAGLGNASFDFSTGTSGIRVAAPGNGAHGYHVEASAGTGSVHVELPDMAGDTQRGSYEGATRGFAGKPVQVRMDLSTGTGSITIIPI